jgi:AcrR family transcriptional regulator
LRVTAELLGEGGFAGLTVEAVADRAGVNKTTIYRRWPTIESLVADALATRSRATIPVPDTGALRSDLLQLLEEVEAAISSPLGKAIVRQSLVRRNGEESVVIEQLRRDFWATRFRLTGEVVRRAIRRGELPEGTDARFVLETLVAPLYFRVFVSGEPIGPDLKDQLVDLVVRGLGAAARRG